MNPKNLKNMGIVGVVIVGVLLVGGGFMLSQKKAPVVPATALKCDQAFFNYVVSKPELIVSATGVDTATTTNVTCEFSYKDPAGTPSANTVTAVLKDAPEGKSWNCSDKDKIFPKGSTTFTVAVSNDRGETSTCGSTIFLQ